MPKGFFTQGVCILLERAVSLDQIEAALADFEIVGRAEADESWAFRGASVSLAYRPESKGAVFVDVVEQTWPDDMGKPTDEPMIFTAWSMGHFGPFAYPGGLERASEQCWHWEEGKRTAARHQAFLRIRSTYVIGAEDDSPVMPEDYAAFPELEFITQVAGALIRLTDALCYFNPNGEILMDQAGLASAIEFSKENDLPPLDVWTNVRVNTLSEEWAAMDTVGCGQLDIPDSEAFSRVSTYDFNEVANFLRNVTLYLLNNGDVFNDGDTMDGPGNIQWQVFHESESLNDPPRDVLRWKPMDGVDVPAEFLPVFEEED
ncbi:MAG: DUF4261 domain-containing protein [Limisphaerales bacterium]